MDRGQFGFVSLSPRDARSHIEVTEGENNRLYHKNTSPSCCETARFEPWPPLYVSQQFADVTKIYRTQERVNFKRCLKYINTAPNAEFRFYQFRNPGIWLCVTLISLICAHNPIMVVCATRDTCFWKKVCTAFIISRLPLKCIFRSFSYFAGTLFVNSY